MKPLFISKYPPIEGYVSSCAFWLARGLASRGHRVTVVTNAYEVEDADRENFTAADLEIYQSRNLRVRNTDPFQDYKLIPSANPFCEKLAAAALELAGEADVIDTWYMVSYGAAGLLVKAASGVPLVVRHAGSDLGRLGANPHLRPLISALLKKADAVVAQPAAREKLKALGAPAGRMRCIPLSVDTGAFNPGAAPAELGAPEGVPVVTFIGKTTKGKGIWELLRAAARVKEDFRLLFVSSGMAELPRLRLPAALRRKLLFKRFVPPWKVPGIIRASRCVVMPEHRFPVRGHSPVLPREVLACGTCLMLSGELNAKMAGGPLRHGESALVVDPTDTENLGAKLRSVIRDEGLARQIGSEGHRLSKKLEDFDRYLAANERLYRKLAR